MKAPILLVEDSPTDAAIMQAALRGIGYGDPIEVLHNGIEALSWLDLLIQQEITDLPRLILLDLNLPRKSGHEILIVLKSHPQLRRIPVIIMSSSLQETDVVKSYELYANAYIVKPIIFEEYKLIAQNICNFWLQTANL